MVPDQIVREVEIRAPVERVWALLTDPVHVAAWYAFDGAEMAVEPGGAVRFSWKEHGQFLGRIEVVDPPRRFQFRYASTVPGTEPAPGNSTQVEFTLIPRGEITHVHLVERGFAGLAGTDADKQRHAAESLEAWTAGLDLLRERERQTDT